MNQTLQEHGYDSNEFKHDTRGTLCTPVGLSGMHVVKGDGNEMSREEGICLCVEGKNVWPQR